MLCVVDHILGFIAKHLVVCMHWICQANACMQDGNNGPFAKSHPNIYSIWANPSYYRHVDRWEAQLARPQTGRVECVGLSERSIHCAYSYLGSDDEEGGLCVELSQGLGHVSAVNVGHKPHIGSAFRVGFQSLCHHQWTLHVFHMTEKKINVNAAPWWLMHCDVWPFPNRMP